MPQATLINQQGKKVAVESGSPQAQQYFSQGYKLDTTPSVTTPTVNNTPTIQGYDVNNNYAPIQVPKGIHVPGVSLIPKEVTPASFDVTKDANYQKLLSENEKLMKTQELQTNATAAGTAASTDNYSKGISDLATTIKDNIQPTFTPEQQKQNTTDLLSKQNQIRTNNLDVMKAESNVDFNPNITTNQGNLSKQQIERENAFKSTALSNEEANLISMVNLSSQEKTALINGTTTIANLQDKIQTHVDAAKQSVLDAAKQLTTDQQNKLAIALDAYKGIDVDKLTAEQTATFSKLVTDAGLDPQLVFKGIKAVNAQQTLDNASKNKPNIQVIGEHYDENAGVMVKDYGYVDATGKITNVNGTPYTGNTTPSTPTGTDAISAFKSSITTQESGNYSAVNKDSGALGAYQFMPTTGLPLVGLDPKNKADIQKFLTTPALQDQAFTKFVGNLSDKYGGDTTKMAAAYYGGDGAAQIVGTEAGNKRQGANGEYPSINEYVKQVGDRMNKITGAVNPNEAPDPEKYQQYGLLANTNFNPSVDTDKTAKLYLDSYLKNATLPTAYNLGLGRSSGGANKFAKAEARAQELYYAATGSSLPDINVLKATKKLVTDNNVILNKNVIQADTITKNFDLAIKGEITNNVNKNATIVNKILNPIYLALGDPAVNQAMVSNGTISQEFANLISIRNASGTTVADKEMANELIRFGTSVDAQKAVVERLKAEATNIHSALVNQNAELYKIIDPLETSKENPNRQNTISGGDVSNQYPAGTIVNSGGKNYKSLGNGQFEEIK